ncbi:MAG: iron-sulfur cluster assembly accessory protein [Acidobacteriota bacterium]|nr:MAG: iron-sulfur cluster assembly accessory protein [Acidobacteriota bacterium]
MLKITDLAREKVLEFMAQEEEPDLALRIAITGRGPAGFEYEFGLVRADEKAEDDVVIDAVGLTVFVEAKSAKKLENASFEFVDTAEESGFRISNPNPLWDDPVAERVQQVIDTKINPAVAMHGGHVTLLDVDGDRVYVRLGGGCQGCGMANVTLKQGIEVMIREEVPEIREIVDSTDHAGGTNPYYQPATGGGAPPL